MPRRAPPECLVWLIFVDWQDFPTGERIEGVANCSPRKRRNSAPSDCQSPWERLHQHRTVGKASVEDSRDVFSREKAMVGTSHSLIHPAACETTRPDRH